jgi:hypothetical protein
MEKNKYAITINNKRIYDYYNANPNISIESMNIILLDFIEQLNSDMSKLITNTINGEILNNVKDIKQQINSLNDNIYLKLNDYNKSFIDTIKMVISMASNENIEKVMQLLNKTTESFVDKINLSIPKSHEENNKKIQDNLLSFQKSINDEIKQYFDNSKDYSLKDFITNLDSKIMNMQQPIYTFINSNHEQILNKFNSFKDESFANKSYNDKVFTELSEFLNKYKTSSQYKGQCSENMLETTLNKMFPIGEVLNTTALKACGDFMIKRDGKQNILIENKNYESNVNLDEIKKFLRDINEQKCNGIMMSQYSGIVSKPNGFIEIHDGKVLIYLHNVEYSQEKIKMAIDVIDNLSSKLATISNTENINGITIKKDILDKINEQFQVFLIQKDTIIASVKELQKKLLSQIEDLNIPDLSLFLADKYASIQNQQFCCDLCNASFNNKRSLASHRKIHKNEENSILTIN